MQHQLSDFIAHARKKGLDHQTIRMVLLSAGWKDKEITAGLVSESLDMPVPLPSDAGGAREGFFHLLTFTALYSTVISLIILAIDWISRTFPDPVFEGGFESAYNYSGIRFSLAIVLVSFPVFVFLSRILHRECVKHPAKLSSGIRRWLTYLTLFVTACTLLGDIITALFYLLQGELTVRFLLKFLAIFVLTGVPFLYYFSVLRMDVDSYARSSIHKQFLGLSSGIVLVTILSAVLLVGGPNFGRMQKMDDDRIQDLRAIHEEALNAVYGQLRYQQPPLNISKLPKPLPKTLEEVAAGSQYAKIDIVDPATLQQYEYTVEGSVFMLCATFDLQRDLEYDIFWNHPSGRHCFQIDALDPRSR